MQGGKASRLARYFGLGALLLQVGQVLAADQAPTGEEDEISMIVEACKDNGPFDRRMCLERNLRDTPFALAPYKPSYFLVSYVNGLDDGDSIYQDQEIKFQISFKSPIWPRKVKSDWRLYFGYSQLSQWQLFNKSESAPFRETNYEPELMIYTFPRWSLAGWNLRLINLGLWKHQSNGRSLPESRSWNRSYVEMVAESGRFYVDLNVWKRWSEPAKTSATDTKGDDNPDIQEYYGHGELRLLYAGEDNNIGLLLRNNFHPKNRGAVQVDWSYPLEHSKKLRTYIQYFNGYGETLIDYNIRRQRIGVGIMLADWL